jgi:hypothetical protein
MRLNTRQFFTHMEQALFDAFCAHLELDKLGGRELLYVGCDSLFDSTVRGEETI